MRKVFSFAIMAILCAMAWAAPVNVQTAKKVGTYHLQRTGLLKATDTLTLAQVRNVDGMTCYYVFNHGEQGFVIVSADDRCTPILGYSMNGSWDESRLPVNMQAWLDESAEIIVKGILKNEPQNAESREMWQKELDANFTIPATPKSNDYLVQSTWEQGYGYNKYCPVMNGSNVVVGCVATAMAQIIRYWEYPTRGFGKKGYSHEAYGLQEVDFDTTDYDYSLMPLHVSYWSSDAEIDMTSQLCYHCGVVVNMNYENPNHTSGSGAHTSKVVEGIRHFGYTDAVHYVRNTLGNDDLWIDMIKNEIDNRRPIEYSGFSNDGGHAFILDGYNNRNQYHFNWGWGGYGDGFYTLTTMMGYVNTHEMVVNIYPSGWDGHLEKFLVSPDGTGNGTSWDQANSNLSGAVKLNEISQHDIWMKEGVYHGDDQNENYCYYINKGVTITGGFAGTETNVNQRDPKNHPTIIDGDNRRGLLYASTRGNRTLKLTDIVLRNGHTEKDACVVLNGNVNANFLTLHNSQCDSGNVLRVTDALLRMGKIYANQAPIVCNVDDGTIRQSLIFNNNGEVCVDMKGFSSQLVNCDIVSNTGTGVVFEHESIRFTNNIVWNNDTSFRADEATSKVLRIRSIIRNCAFESDTQFVDSTWIALSHDNTEVRFVNPGQRGVEGYNAELDWHLAQGSVCIDKGARISESLNDGDLDRGVRCRNGIIDLGCYETNYPVSINNLEHPSFSVYPNPATSTITIEGAESNDATIYDMNGRAVMQTKGNTADVSTLATGMYYLRLQGKSVKFVKQ